MTSNDGKNLMGADKRKIETSTRLKGTATSAGSGQAVLLNEVW